jgi:hypothetical protein
MYAKRNTNGVIVTLIASASITSPKACKTMNKQIMIAALAIMLTARLGTITYNNHRETWYDLPMQRIVERADSIYGLSDVYAVRSDGVKTYNGLVIVAADWDLHPFGSIIETSRGTGIVLDTHTADRSVVDIATDWKE